MSEQLCEGLSYSSGFVITNAFFPIFLCVFWYTDCHTLTYFRRGWIIESVEYWIKYTIYIPFAPRSYRVYLNQEIFDVKNRGFWCGFTVWSFWLFHFFLFFLFFSQKIIPEPYKTFNLYVLRISFFFSSYSHSSSAHFRFSFFFFVIFLISFWHYCMKIESNSLTYNIFCLDSFFFFFCEPEFSRSFVSVHYCFPYYIYFHMNFHPIWIVFYADLKMPLSDRDETGRYDRNMKTWKRFLMLRQTSPQLDNLILCSFFCSLWASCSLRPLDILKST